VALGVLCLETYWSEDVTDRRTVHGLLKLLEENEPAFIADHAHTATRGEIRAYLANAWPVPSYDVLYVASHGLEGGIVDEDDSRVTLSHLAGMLERTCAGRVIFFAGCSTLNVRESVVKTFLKRTKAAAVVGYSKDVDWLEGAQMDLIVLGALSRGGPDSMGTWTKPPEQILSAVRERHTTFAQELGWDYRIGESRLPKTRREVPDGVEEAIGHLLAVAVDESVDAATRARMLRAVGRLGVWNREVADLIRDREAPITVRKAAVAALNAVDAPEARKSRSGLRERLTKDHADPGRKALLHALAC